MREESMKLRVKLMTATARAPERGSAGAVGYDLRADLGGAPARFMVPAGCRRTIPTGVAVAVPEGHYGRVAPRSGLAAKQGIDVLAGVVDPDYRGEVKVLLLNTGESPMWVEHGDRIAQLVLEKVSVPDVDVVDVLDETERADGGFGSTGVG